MILKGPAQRVIHRFGKRFESNREGILEVDIDSLKTKSTTLDENGNEITFLEGLSSEDKKELLSAFKAYGFTDTAKAKKEVEPEVIETEK